MKRSTIIVTDLEADSDLGLGITASVLDNGDIIIKSLMRNGPAEHDGHLHVGDHINSVDGHSLDGATQADVDRLIHQTCGCVRVIASRPSAWRSDPGLSPGGLSDCSGDYTLNSRSMNSDGGESSGRRILRLASVESSDVDLDTGQSPRSLNQSCLTMAECHTDTAGL